jgi:hypothetical protein
MSGLEKWRGLPRMESRGSYLRLECVHPLDCHRVNILMPGRVRKGGEDRMMTCGKSQINA